MTSPLYLAPDAMRIRTSGRLYVNKAPYGQNSPDPNSLTARKVHPLSKNSGPKHKAQHPYTRRIR